LIGFENKLNRAKQLQTDYLSTRPSIFNPSELRLFIVFSPIILMQAAILTKAKLF